MALIGFTLNIPNILGENIIVDKIAIQALNGFKHPEIVVSQENPVAFFSLNKDFLEISADGIQKFIGFPEKNIFGFEFAEYILNKEVSKNLIKDKLPESAVGFVQQLFWGDNLVINIKHIFKPKNESELKISEIHINPLQPSLPLSIGMSSVPNMKGLSLSFMRDKESFMKYIEENDPYGIISMQKRIAEKMKELGKIKKTPEFIRDLTVTRMVNDIIANNNFWYSEQQYLNEINDFRNQADKPKIEKEDIEKYVSSIKDKGEQSVAKEYDMFFPSFIEWCPSFQNNMVGLYIAKGHFLFTGVDDMECHIDHTFKNKEDAIEFIKNQKIEIITHEVLDKIKANIPKKRPRLKL